LLLDFPASGATFDEILENYPQLQRQQRRVRFKLDENSGSRSARLFPEAGHNVETVVQEGLGGASDESIFDACIRENRCLLSLDLDFADVVRFPPHRTAGIGSSSAEARIIEPDGAVRWRPAKDAGRRVDQRTPLDCRGRPHSRHENTGLGYHS